MQWICILIGFTLFTAVSTQLFCSDLLAPNKTKYYPVRHCQRSNKTRIAAKNVENLEKCAQFAEYNQGLAFNFGHGHKPRKLSDQNNLINLFDTIKEGNKTNTIKRNLEISNDPYFNCEVLDCPEVGNMSTIINDTRYDYYSLYGNAPGNTTCMPSMALFMIYYNERKNYTQAAITCEFHGGYLANGMSYERTNFLSSLVSMESNNFYKNAIIFSETQSHDSALKMLHAFIGLREVQRKGEFFDSNNVPIKCYRFRAWEPKFPIAEKTLGCVAVTDSRSWKMFDCRKRMPFICELKASKPRRIRRFDRRCSLRRSNN